MHSLLAILVRELEEATLLTDELAEVYGIEREPGEDNDSLTERISWEFESEEFRWAEDNPDDA